MGIEQRRPLIEQIQEKRGGSHVICCITSDRNNAQGVIAKDFLFRFFEHLRKTPTLEKLDIFLFTIGGDTLAAYALGRFIRQFSKKIGMLIPHTCHSGGTLFALAANEIVMTRVATLSSIDPSIVGQLNPLIEIGPGQRGPVPVGVESIGGFRNTVHEDWRLDEEGSAMAFRLLAEKVHPLLLGDLYRAREQIIRLASTLLRLHIDEEGKIQELVNTLATGLGSHDYLIGATEARDLGLKVQPENADLEELMWKLYEDFAAEMELGVPFDPAIEIQTEIAKQPAPQPVVIPQPMVVGMPQPQQMQILPLPNPIKRTLKTVIIESTERQDRWERELTIVPSIPVAQMQLLWNYWRSS